MHTKRHLRLTTMGVALGACTIPVAGAPGFSLGPEELEMGLGIHGEKGVRRENIRPADALVDDMLDVILADGGLRPTDRVVLLVNNLGGTTLMELAVVARRALHTLRSRGLVVERAWMGTLLSALEMPGCSLSVMKVDDDVLSFLDEKTAAPAWPGGGTLPQAPNILTDHADATETVEGIASRDAAGPAVRRAALACAAALEAAEPTLTQLDSATGDGDLGISMSRGAAAMRAWCATDGTGNAAAVLAGIAGVLRRVIGGSSGPFYAVALLRAARHLAASGGREGAEWQAAFAEGTNAIAELGGARAGDRTMLDALLPAAEALGLAVRRNLAAGESWRMAAEAAEGGAEATAAMLPGLGRASYLGRRALGSKDGGAVAVSIWLRAIADAHT